MDPTTMWMNLIVAMAENDDIAVQTEAQALGMHLIEGGELPGPEAMTAEAQGAVLVWLAGVLRQSEQQCELIAKYGKSVRTANADLKKQSAEMAEILERLTAYTELTATNAQQHADVVAQRDRLQQQVLTMAPYSQRTSHELYEQHLVETGYLLKGDLTS